jgi:hypothetical protein
LHRGLKPPADRDQVVQETKDIEQIRLPGRVRTNEKDARLQFRIDS